MESEIPRDWEIEEDPSTEVQRLTNENNRLNEENARLTKEIARLTTQGGRDSAPPHNLPSEVMIGRARYSDLLKLDEARLKTLDGRLVAFAMWVTQQKHETAVGDAARARVARMLDDFDIRYCDHDVEAGTAQHGSFRELVECGSTWIDNFDNCLVNRAYWSNRHQNCFLVVEALSTVRSLMRWRGIGLGAV